MHYLSPPLPGPAGPNNELAPNTPITVNHVSTTVYANQNEVVTAYTSQIPQGATIAVAFNSVNGSPAIYKMAQVAAHPTPPVLTILRNDILEALPLILDCSDTTNHIVTLRAWNSTSTTWERYDTPDTGTTPSVPFNNFNDPGSTGLGTQGWYDFLIISNVDTRTANFRAEYQIGMSNRTAGGDDLTSCVIEIYGMFGVLGKCGATITDLTNGSGSLAFTQLRVVRTDGSDLNSDIRLQIYCDTTIAMNASSLGYKIPGWLDVQQVATLYVQTGSESTLCELDFTSWLTNQRSIHFGTSDGVRANFIGAPDVDGVGVDMSTGHVQLQSNGLTNVDVQDHGVRISGGDYGAWTLNSSDDPWAVSEVFETLTFTGRTDPDNTNLQPFPTVTVTGVDTSLSGGDWARSNYVWGSEQQQMLYATTNDRRSILSFTFTNVTATTRFTIEFNFLKLVGFTESWDLVDINDVNLGTMTIDGTEPDPQFYRRSVTFTIPPEAHGTDYVIRLIRNATSDAGSTNRAGLASWSVVLESVRPDQMTNTVAQFDSPTKPIMLPRVLPTSSITHVRGTTALDGVNQRPIWHDGEAWSYGLQSRVVVGALDKTLLYYPSGGGLDDAGFTGGFSNWPYVVDGYQGFGKLLKFPNTTDTPGIGVVNATAPAWTAADWQDMYDKGFVFTCRFLFVSCGFHGWNFAPIEAGTSWTDGRFVVNIQNGTTANTFQVKDENSNTLSEEFPAGEMNSLNIIFQDPSSGSGRVYLNGNFLFETVHGGSGSERGLFIYDNDSANRELYYESLTMLTMADSTLDETLSRTAIETGLIYTKPTSSSIGVDRLRIPKGSFDQGVTAFFNNGSYNNTLRISGEDDNHIPIGPAEFIDVPPKSAVGLIQTAFPKGSDWAVLGGLPTASEHAEGRSIELHIDGPTANIISRGGTQASDLTFTVTKPATGTFNIAHGAIPSFPDSTRVWVSITENLLLPTDGNIIGFRNGVGDVAVLTTNAGAAADLDFTVLIKW